MKKTMMTIAGLLLATCATADPINLVTNGDFEAPGLVGFSTAYDYVQPNTMGMWDAGTVTRNTSAAHDHPLWETSGDHTGGGSFLEFNGRSDYASTAWATTVPTEVGQTYYFEAFAKNLCCNVALTGHTAPKLSLWINDVLVNAWVTGAAGVWSVTDFAMTALTGTTTLEIRDASTDKAGNDFGLDDIYFGEKNPAVPEPASLALVGGGLLYLARRFKRA